MFRYNLRLIIRNIRKSKIYSFINILGLALGIAAFSTEKRSVEIGIRKVLGSTTNQITVLITRQFIIWITLAIIIASPIAYHLMDNWLNNFAYRISISPSVFLLSAAIALITVSWQAIRAATANPVESLRYE